MDAFWDLARRMLRYRRLIVLALVFAFISAGGIAAGLVAIQPVLTNILSPERARGLPEILNESFEALNNSQDWPRFISWRIPTGWIELLPSGRFEAVVAIILGLGLLTLVGGVANFLHAFLSMTVVQRSVADIRRVAFHRVLRMPLDRVVAAAPDANDVGTGGASDTVSRVVNDAWALEQGFTALLSKAVSQLFRGLAAFIAALIIDWRLTLVAILVAPILGVVIKKLGKRIRRATKAAYASTGKLMGAATEAVQGLRVVKVHTTERYEAGRFHAINKDVMRQMFRARTAKALASPLIEVLAIVVLGALSLVAAKAIIDQNLRPESFILAIVALAAAGEALRPLTGLYNDIQSSAGPASRLREIMDAAPEPGHERTLPTLGRHKDSIEFRGVTFAYPSHPIAATGARETAVRPALDRVSLTVRHGQRVAIVGPNGSGKTTLLALVPRLFSPQEGSILVDGVDIAAVSVRSLRGQIGVVTQETVLFKGTIRTNIAYGNGDATHDEIRHAARMARAAEFIEALPQGYDTPVGEQGLTLSGGQRQRIAIARAILRDPAILILDEATSMIDSGSEAQIAAALEDFSKGRTTLVVAHRLSTVVSSDTIVVMESGKVIDTGRHAELLTRCAVYKAIAEKQLISEPPVAGVAGRIGIG